MKTTFRLLTVAMVCAFHFANATVLTVSNDPQSPGQYTSITSAITAAANGDTIYIHGTNINYGSFSVNKGVTFIGSGHNPQNQNTSRSLMNTVTLVAGSDGSKFYGLVIFGNLNSSVAISNVTVVRNIIYGLINLSANCPNWRVESNVFASSGQNIYLGYAAGTNNWYSVKNVFNGYLDGFNGAYNYFFNNLFLRNGTPFSGVSYVYFYNNIFYRATPNGSSNCTFEKNLSYLCSPNTFANGTNLEGQNPLFVNFPSGGAYFDYSHNYRLQGASPCIDYGIDAEDLGVYGGSMGHYEQNGIPNIPQIREFNLTSSSTVPVGGTININVKSTIRP